MKKNLLLVAASVAAMTAAGAATASDFTVSLQGVTVTPTDPYTIAQQAQGVLTGAVQIDVEYDQFVPSANNLKIRVQLENATFTNRIQWSDIKLLTRDADGDPEDLFSQQRTISEGGEPGDDHVVFLVSADEAQQLKIVEFSPMNISFAAKAVPTVSVYTTTEHNTKIENGYSKFAETNADKAVLVDYSDLVDVTITHEGKAVLALDEDDIFSKFNATKSTTPSTDETEAELGKINVTLNSVYLPSLVSGNNYNLTDVTVAGDIISYVHVDYTGIYGGTTGVTLSPISWQTFNPNGILWQSSVVASLTGTSAKSNSDYEATVTVHFVDGYASETTKGELAPIRREGVTAEVPWIASAAVATANGTRSNIRVANKGDTDAAVYAEYVTTSGVPNTRVGPGVPQYVGTAEAGRDLQVTQAKLTEVLGEFNRGNIIITVEANLDDITVNSRVTTGDGSFDETSVYLID